MDENVKLTYEQLEEELRSVKAEYENTVRLLERKIDRLSGIIEGMKFAIRCDGVSGSEVR